MFAQNPESEIILKLISFDKNIILRPVNLLFTTKDFNLFEISSMELMQFFMETDEYFAQLISK